MLLQCEIPSFVVQVNANFILNKKLLKKSYATSRYEMFNRVHYAEVSQLKRAHGRRHSIEV